ncbi:Ctr copper transporter family-domain-containing protein [Bombardia bombarda]|uniref:Copper transport protein n=1 Tax=Bombardia bombarda TaxID=252184 RepID=A0AA40C9B3_9PEZI|nr:Ctr copper transporter family-domain-containing protein [Bombardia bombarda]
MLFAMPRNAMDAEIWTIPSAAARAVDRTIHPLGRRWSGLCQNEEFWNWRTIDTCLLTSSWYITSHGIFALSCLGVVALTLLLEFLRRISKDYDRYLLSRGSEGAPQYRPGCWEQAGRAFLFMLQVANAYILILLAVHYNGYIILCIVLGSYFGFYVFRWEYLRAAVAPSPLAQSRNIGCSCGVCSCPPGQCRCANCACGGPAHASAGSQ